MEYSSRPGLCLFGNSALLETQGRRTVNAMICRPFLTWQRWCSPVAQCGRRAPRWEDKEDFLWKCRLVLWRGSVVPRENALAPPTPPARDCTPEFSGPPVLCYAWQQPRSVCRPSLCRLQRRQGHSLIHPSAAQRPPHASILPPSRLDNPQCRPPRASTRSLVGQRDHTPATPRTPASRSSVVVNTQD